MFLFYKKKRLTGKRVLITAGPTYEPIDPVRFIGNHSSGLMGFCLAKEAESLGADVTLISGPVDLKTPDGVRRINVFSADDMFEAVMCEFSSSDISIMAAAVADFTPLCVSKNKIKKETLLNKDSFIIELKQTKDILASICKLKRPDQIVVGFALETDNEIENAKRKLKVKNADFIVLNSASEEGSGFRVNTNKVYIITKDLNVIHCDLKPKSLVAKDILNIILEE